MVIGLSAADGRRTSRARCGRRGGRGVHGLVSANPDAALADAVDVHLGLDTGPEAIAGSTRLKAATGQKWC